MFVIFGHMIDQSGLPAVRLGAAQLLSRTLLTCRGLYQRRAGKEDRSLIAHNHGFVRHGRNVRPARSAAAPAASGLAKALQPSRGSVGKEVDRQEKTRWW